MTDTLLFALYKFFEVLDIILLIYIISSWLPLPRNIKGILNAITAPMLDPIRYLLSKSIIGGTTGRVPDFSPIIAFIVLAFLQNLFIPLS